MRFQLLAVLFFAISVPVAAQVDIAVQSFEDIPAIDVRYTDTGDMSSDHDIVNNAGEPIVDYTAPAPLGGGPEQLSFDSRWENTRNGDGLDNDYAGVADYTSVVGSYPHGDQGFKLSDTDGLVVVDFSSVDISEMEDVSVSVDIFLNRTRWESNDLIHIWATYNCDACGGGSVDLINSAGLDIDDMGLEDNWTTVSALIPAGASSVELHVGFDSSQFEELMYMDRIRVRGAVVPVELTSFTATVNGNDINLNWETASETNNAGFEMQLLGDGQYQPIGFVEGHGTTTEAQSYSHTVSGMDAGTYTFRLKQIDFDGAFEYSPEVEATIDVVGTHQLSNAYPNPFNPTSQFTLAVASNQTVKAELYNVLGQRVATLFNGSVDANTAQIVQIDGNGLASGAYIVRVTGETFADALRVTLTK